MDNTIGINTIGITRTPSWVTYILNRIARNKNFLGIVSGQTGSGKSWSALRLAELLDPEFTIERIVFKGTELMELINSGKLKRGSVIVWEETQIELSNRNWMSLMNKMLNYLISTFRHKNFILLFTAPYVDFIDSATMKLFHANFQTAGIDKKTQTVKLKVKQLQYNQDLKKWYPKYLKVVQNGSLVKIKEFHIGKPSQSLIDEYEAKKNEFTHQLNLEIERKLKAIDNKNNKTILTPQQDSIVKCWEQGIFNTKEISNIVGLDVANVNKMYITLTRKGYDYKTYMKPETLKRPNIAVLSPNKAIYGDSNRVITPRELNLDVPPKKMRVITLSNGEKITIPNAIPRPNINNI